MRSLLHIYNWCCLQEVLADCFADCASEHLSHLPKLRQDLEARLQQRPSSRQGGGLFN